ncbi:MFS multidrug transporter protein [Rutstroemia sp. NJR-2017a BBW]|nr:MFS multidrug transporter protein [Rutstroemia sp. NJR-2017a BBW]
MAAPVNPTERSPLLDPTSGQAEDGTTSRESVANGEVFFSNEPTTLQMTKATSGVFLGIIFVAVDSSMIATLSAPISSTFGSLSRLPWLVSTFFIANAAIQPLCGKLTDIYGRRDGLILSNIIFSLGNLMCALAQSEWVLICGRLVAGIGGGGIAAISTFVLSDLVPVRRRGVWQGIGNIFFGAGSGLGGYFGGWLNDYINWRAAFWIQIPFTVLATILIFFTVNIPITNSDTSKSSKIRQIDFLGASTLFASLTLLLLALSSGGNIVPWLHPLVLTSLPLSLLFLLAFVLTELKVAAQPIIPVNLLWDWTIAGACLTNFFSSMSRFALLFYLPVYLQIQGYSPSETGLRLVPGSFAAALASLVSGVVIRSTGRYYRLGVSSQVIYFVGMSTIVAFNLKTPAWIPFVSFSVTNIGFGAMVSATIVAILAVADQKNQAVLTSALLAFRSTGTVIGITLAGLTFQNVLRSELWNRIGDIDHADEQIKRIIADLDVIWDFPTALKDQILQAHMSALTAVFAVILGMGGLGIVTSFFVKDITLPRKAKPSDSNR